MQCGVGLCGHCQLGPLLGLPGRTGRALRGRRRPAAQERADDPRPPHPGRVEVRVVRRLPAQPARLRGRAAGPRRSRPDRPLHRDVPGPGRRALRRVAGGGLDLHRGDAGPDPRGPPVSRRLVTIGACATAGGIQALRNSAARRRLRRGRLRPSRLHLLVGHLHADLGPRAGRRRAAGMSHRPPPAPRGDHRGAGRPEGRSSPATPSASSARAAARSACWWPEGTPCLGPVTRAGCGALCPSVGRGCFGCFGPSEGANPRSLSGHLVAQGMVPVDASRLFATFYVGRSDLRRRGGRAGRTGHADRAESREPS